ncbi:MAG: hypothetical protein AAF065_07950 [Verrucomicrobiota bacterium]
MKNRLLQYSAASATGVLASTSAWGNIQYSGLINLSLNFQDGDELYIDIDGMSTVVQASAPAGADFRLQDYGGDEFDLYRQSSPGGTVRSTGFSIRDFSSGETIGVANTFSAGGTFYNGGTFDNSLGQYAGVAFDSGSGIRYGWLQLQFDQVANTINLVDFAYDDSGADIAAGAVPEPAHAPVIAALLAGSAAACMRRQQKKA